MSEAATLLLDAWRHPARLLPGLPEALRPRDEAQAYAVQHAVSAGLGEVGGWKVGAAGPDAPPSCAPLPLAHLHASPAHLPADTYTLRGIESEIAFRMGRDLPPRAAPYTRAEVLDAIASCHATIEVLQSRFEDDGVLDAPTRLADFLSHGGLVHGPAIEGWRGRDLAALTVAQEVDGATERTGTANPAGDMIRLVVWLANEGATWAGGLRAGQFVTCGSWTGKAYVAPGARVRACFTDAPPVEAVFA